MSDVAEIVHRLDELEKQFATAQRERDEYRRLYLEMMERCRKLERGLLSSKSEHLSKDDSQLTLDVLSMMLGDRQTAELDAALAAANAEQEVRAHTRPKPTGRKPIPENVPRVDIEIVPPEVQRAGLDAFDRIGEEVSEVIERRPASLVVARIIRPKFVLKLRERDAPTEVLIGKPPELPIPKGLAGPGMLADTIVKRWQDHLPLHRLEDIYERDGLELARSTMCGWHAELAQLAKPLVAAMRADAFEQPYLCTDATGVLVQHAEKCRTGHFWVLVAPERHVLFEYTSEHSGDAVDDVLAGYRGYLVADAHVVYDHLYRTGELVEVNCWAHYLEMYVIHSVSDLKLLKASSRLLSPDNERRSIAVAMRKPAGGYRDRLEARRCAVAHERPDTRDNPGVRLLGAPVRRLLRCTPQAAARGVNARERSEVRRQRGSGTTT